MKRKSSVLALSLFVLFYSCGKSKIEVSGLQNEWISAEDLSVKANFDTKKIEIRNDSDYVVTFDSLIWRSCYENSKNGIEVGPIVGYDLPLNPGELMINVPMPPFKEMDLRNKFLPVPTDLTDEPIKIQIEIVFKLESKSESTKEVFTIEK